MFSVSTPPSVYQLLGQFLRSQLLDLLLPVNPSKNKSALSHPYQRCSTHMPSEHARRSSSVRTCLRYVHYSPEKASAPFPHSSSTNHAPAQIVSVHRCPIVRYEGLFALRERFHAKRARSHDVSSRRTRRAGPASAYTCCSSCDRTRGVEALGRAKRSVACAQLLHFHHLSSSVLCGMHRHFTVRPR